MSTRNRLVAETSMPAEEIAFSPHNWRRGTRAQNEVLLQLLAEIGWVEGVLLNQRTGRLVDGEKRVLLARQRQAGEIPVSVVDLDEEEERLVVATLDAITGQAMPDESEFGVLRAVIEADLKGPLAGLAALTGLAPKMEVLEEEEQGGLAGISGVSEDGGLGEDVVTLVFGPDFKVTVSKEAYVAWRHRLFEEIGFKEKEITPVLRARLGMEDIEL